ncbi:hypothetical protein [Flammeovirga sp. SJP92]|uniref:hypothetical protein n=1 Tax=Flammeovirga sp. SJP92 TaxID=1775430 RepID=UPI000787F1E3|nr:hypothetical protein [Flammeovirga sp. SJP92]KXX67793.1 hypothetical protein AVL50_25360 [Flammeovirga sp. SJP92]
MYLQSTFTVLLFSLFFFFSNVSWGQKGNTHDDPFVVTDLNQTFEGSLNDFTKDLPMGLIRHEGDSPNIWFSFICPQNIDYLRIDYILKGGGLPRLSLYDQDGIDSWKNNGIDTPLFNIKGGIHGRPIIVTSDLCKFEPGKKYYITFFSYSGTREYKVDFSTQYKIGDSPSSAIEIDFNSFSNNWQHVEQPVNLTIVPPAGGNTKSSNRWFKFTYPEDEPSLQIKFIPLQQGIGRITLFDQSKIDLWNSEQQDEYLLKKKSDGHGQPSTISSNDFQFIKGNVYYFSVHAHVIADDTEYSVNMIKGDENDGYWSIIEKYQSLSSLYPKVGIGTENPTSTLEVNGDIAISSMPLGESSTSKKLILNGQSIADKNIWLSRHDNSNNSELRINLASGISPIDNQLSIGYTVGYDWIPKFSFSKSGKLSINTLDPGKYSLAVNGSIGSNLIESKEVIVTPQIEWPDYVFNEDYPLMPLDQLQKYLNEHKHLPEIPSAEEVKEKGLSIGDQNALLLKKIEELTLHIINQEQEIKRLEQLNDKVELLEKQLLLMTDLLKKNQLID